VNLSESPALCNTARMRRFLLTRPLQLQPPALEAQLPPCTQRLVLTLNAPQPGRIIRTHASALWRALREQEKALPTLKYHLALNPGPFETGEPACWLGITGASQPLLLDAVRAFDVLLRRHIRAFTPADNSAKPAPNHTLLEELERRNGWRIAISGDLELLREQLKGAPPEALAQFPHLRLGRIFLMLKDVRVHDAEKEWRQFRLDLTHGRYPDFPAWEAGLMRELVASYSEAPVTPARYLHFEHLARQIPQHDADARGIVHNCLCSISIDGGDIPRALAAADASAHAYTQAGSGYGNLFIHYLRGMALAVSGQFTSARAHYRKGVMLSRRQLAASHELPSIGLALLAGLDDLDNQTAKAAAAMETAIGPIEQGESWSHLLWLVYRTWIELAAREHDPAALERALRHARATARNRNFRRLETRLDLLEIEIDLRRDALDSARLRARQMHLNALAQRPPERDFSWRQTIWHARYLALLLRLPQIKPGERQQAAALVEQARQADDFEFRIRAMLLCAQMDVHLEQSESALCLLEDALILLLPEKPNRLLLNHPGIGPLLALYRRAAHPRQAARQLQGLLGELERAARNDARLTRSHAHRLALTAREQDILRELAQGCRNKEIAQRLGCSENTVKFHLKRLNGKFSTHKRADLVAHARAAGVLE